MLIMHETSFRCPKEKCRIAGARKCEKARCIVLQNKHGTHLLWTFSASLECSSFCVPLSATGVLGPYTEAEPGHQSTCVCHGVKFDITCQQDCLHLALRLNLDIKVPVCAV